MIRLTCTNCQASLTIDDAFAGGVCRCQHCGTIQTVPRAGEAADAMTSKALYQSDKRRRTGNETELDTLAEIVASSGLSGSGLYSSTTQRKRQAAPYATPQAQKKSLLPLWIALGVLALLATIAGGLFFFRSTAVTVNNAPATIATPAVTSSGGPIAVKGPSFAGVELKTNSVVYLIDRGQSTEQYFGDLKAVLLKSIQSLGPDRKFQIVCWDNDGEMLAYPPRTMSFAMSGEVKSVTRWIDELFATGQTEIGPALKTALGQNPGEIVIATGKAWQFDAPFAEEVLTARGDKPVIIHTIALGSVTDDNPLARIAFKSKGTAVVRSASEFREYAE